METWFKTLNSCLLLYKIWIHFQTECLSLFNPPNGLKWIYLCYLSNGKQGTQDRDGKQDDCIGDENKGSSAKGISSGKMAAVP